MTTDKDVFQKSMIMSIRTFEEAGIEYFYTLIDDVVARIIRSEGGMWACRIMTEMLC